MNNFEFSTKDIALDLLGKWIEDELSIIYEYSDNFDVSKELLWGNVDTYLKKLKATDLIEKFKAKIFE